MNKKFWSWKNSVTSDASELIIEGDISSQESWWGDSATPEMLRDELKEHSGDITVSLNSGGGDVFAGVAMYNALRKHDGNVTIRVDGLAASIASIIAMAGEKIIMSPGSMMMIHKPWTFAMGDSTEMEKVKGVLDSIEQSMLPIYTARTGKTTEEIQEMLESETWMTAQEAVELGFADEFIEAKEGISISDSIKNLVHGKFAYSMSVTEKSMTGLLEKVKAEKVKDEDVSTITPPSTDEVVEPTEPAESKDEAEEVKEVETDNPTEVAEPVVENKAKKETNKMDKDLEAQIIEPKDQAPVEAAKPTMKAYLKSKDAMNAFARVLEEQAGKSSADVKAAWGEHLSTKMGVTNPEIFLPDALITRIEDAFREGGEIWNRVTKTGADVFKSAWDAEDDVNSNDGRGRGYNREVEDEKAEQILTFADRVLRPQFVYKYIVLNREDVKNQRSTGALVAYVLSELPRRIIREVERAIVIGDGRAPGSAYKINESSDGGIFSIKTDATSGTNNFATVYTPESDENRYATLIQAMALVRAPGDRVLIAKRGFLTELLLQTNANGGFLFAPGTNLGQLLGFSAVIEPDWMDSDATYDAYVVALSNYRTVGDTSIEAFTNFLLKTNQQEYLQEIYVGGGLTVRESAVAIAVATS